MILRRGSLVNPELGDSSKDVRMRMAWATVRRCLKNQSKAK